jgi:folate-binding protein YgfZ
VLPYDTAIHQAGFCHLHSPGVVRIDGEDRLAFLQRQTTNDLRLLATDRAVVTVLTSPTARILDVLTVLDEGKTLAAICLRPVETARFLRGRIFFNDHVTVNDISAELARIDLDGPQSPVVIEKAGLPLPASDTQVITANAATVGVHAAQGLAMRLLGQGGFSGAGFRLLTPATSLPALEDRLLSLGAARLSPEIYDILRVEYGQPAARHELTEAFTPLEIGLESAISADKGCYTGQEVIARQITSGKVTRRLVGLKLTTPMPGGAKLQAEGKPAGEITSCVTSPRFGPIALAVIRKPYDEPGMALNVDKEVIATVTPLPFVQERG